MVLVVVREEVMLPGGESLWCEDPSLREWNRHLHFKARSQNHGIGLCGIDLQVQGIRARLVDFLLKLVGIGKTHAWRENHRPELLLVACPDGSDQAVRLPATMGLTIHIARRGRSEIDLAGRTVLKVAVTDQPGEAEIARMIFLEQSHAQIVGVEVGLIVFEASRLIEAVAHDHSRGKVFGHRVFHTKDRLEDVVVERTQSIARIRHAGLRIPHIGEDAPAFILGKIDRLARA